MSIDGNTIWRTETKLLEPICSIRAHDGYEVFRSDAFPKFYGGNGIAIHSPGNGTLAEWESRFHEHFEPEVFDHFMFTFPDAPEFSGIAEQAREKGYDEVSLIVGVVIEDREQLVEVSDRVEIRRVDDEAHWQALEHFEIESSRDEAWFSESVCRQLFAKSRRVSEAIGIEWFCLYERGGDEILAKLGIFKEGDVARLQNVATALHRRREGLASQLVSFATHYAFDTLGASGLAICADDDYHALELYRKLGGRDAMRHMWLMKYGAT